MYYSYFAKGTEYKPQISVSLTLSEKLPCTVDGEHKNSQLVKVQRKSIAKYSEKNKASISYSFS